ncbi:SCO family protein, partial [Escherichia coli]|nr:SCO family protein [Escherichia coli]
MMFTTFIRRAFVVLLLAGAT